MVHNLAIRRAKAPMPAPAPMLAIASGKGGVGKTWFAVTLAALWGKAKKRTLLVDADFACANIDIQLGVRPQTDLSALLRGMIDLEGAVTPIRGGAVRSGFDLLSGHSGSGALANLRLEDVHRVAKALGDLAPHYDRMIVDLAAGLDASTLRLARAAQKLVVLTTEEPTALTDAYAFLKVLHLSGAEAKPHVVVNMAERRQNGRRVYEQLAKACEAYLGFRPAFAGAIVRDACVPDCIRAQTPLPMRHASSEALTDMMRIAEALSV